MKKQGRKMPRQAAPIARNLNTTAQAADQNGVEASVPWPLLAGAAIPAITSLFN